MNQTLVENKYGHGALPLISDWRDHQWEKLAQSIAPFDWATGYTASFSLPVKDQGGSFSCGGQAGSGLLAIVRQVLWNEPSTERSARYMYSQIFYTNGGTTLRDILNFAVNKGCADEVRVLSYQGGNPPTEAFMEDTSDNNAQADTSATAYKGLSYAFVNPDIDSYAEAIKATGGAIMQINGKNNGTWDSAEPLPPLNLADSVWSHFVVCVGAEMRNGKKVIKIRNSWGSGVGEVGYQYISEDYFASGCVLQGGVVYDPVMPSITPVAQQKIFLVTTLIALLQKMKNLISGPTKQGV